MAWGFDLCQPTWTHAAHKQWGRSPGFWQKGVRIRPFHISRKLTFFYSRVRKLPTEELANESRSTHITVAADMVFSLSHFLSGVRLLVDLNPRASLTKCEQTAIVDFVQALSDVSWEEIQSSGLSQHPRLFSLQKLVEISYYNMTRIRLEWSNLWDILGEHFKLVSPNLYITTLR